MALSSLGALGVGALFSLRPVKRQIPRSMKNSHCILSGLSGVLALTHLAIVHGVWIILMYPFNIESYLQVLSSLLYIELLFDPSLHSLGRLCARVAFCFAILLGISVVFRVQIRRKWGRNVSLKLHQGLILSFLGLIVIHGILNGTIIGQFSLPFLVLCILAVMIFIIFQKGDVRSRSQVKAKALDERREPVIVPEAVEDEVT